MRFAKFEKIHQALRKLPYIILFIGVEAALDYEIAVI